MVNSLKYPIRNDFSLIGLSERCITEDVEYTQIFEFEKIDYLPIFVWVASNESRILSLVFVYLAAVWALQRWMRTREAFDLRRPLLFWNSFLTVLSVAMFSRLLPETIYINKVYGFYRSYCKMDHINAASAFSIFLYALSKSLEFFDTAFIILRKQKLTFLHVFHHSSVYLMTIFSLIRGDTRARYFVLMNTLVHTIMYSYYALKAAKFKLPRTLSMVVTSVQLLQFIAGISINVLVLSAKLAGTQPHCDGSNVTTFYFFVLGLLYLYLFGNFFVESYIKKPKRQ